MCQNTNHISTSLSSISPDPNAILRRVLPRRGVVNEKTHSKQANASDSLGTRVENEMIGAVASFFECSLLLVATFTALYSIVGPKLKGAAYYGLILLPLSMLLPMVAASDGTGAGEKHGKMASSKE